MTDAPAPGPPGAPDPSGRHSVGAAVRQGFVWNLVNFVASQGAGIVIFLTLSRAVSPAMFGVFALAAIVVDMIAMQGRWAGMDAIIQRRDFSPAALSSAFFSMMGVGVLASLIAFLAAGPAAQALGEPDLAFVLPALSLTLLLTPAAVVMDAILMRELKFRSQALRSLAGTLIGGGVGIAVAFSAEVNWALVAQRVAGMAVTLVVLFAITRWLPTWTFDRANALQFLARAGQLWAATAFASIHARIIEAFVGIRAGAVDLGLINVARRFELVLHGIATSPIQGIWVPVLSHLRADSAESWRLFVRLYQLCAFIALPAFVGLALIAHELVAVALDQRYAAAGDILFIIALQGVFMPVSYFSNLVFAGLDRSDLSLKLSVANLIITAPIVWIAAGYGAYWALFSALFAMAGVGIVATLMQIRMLHGKVSEFLAALTPGYAACAFMTICVALLQAALPENPALNLVLLPICGFVTFAGWLLAFHRNQLRAAWDFISAVRSGDPAAIIEAEAALPSA
jgi:O-antigen/teichoic acid export membrane protein